MDNLYDKITSHDSIWSLMYPDYINCMSTEEQIIEIKIEELRWSKNKQVAYYVWGWPGPDVNMYNVDNFGITWHFNKDELINYWKNKKND